MIWNDWRKEMFFYSWSRILTLIPTGYKQRSCWPLSCSQLGKLRSHSAFKGGQSWENSREMELVPWSDYNFCFPWLGCCVLWEMIFLLFQFELDFLILAAECFLHNVSSLLNLERVRIPWCSPPPNTGVCHSNLQTMTSSISLVSRTVPCTPSADECIRYEQMNG